MQNIIQHAIAISEPSYNGNRVTRIALQYSVPVDQGSIGKDAYSVSGRTLIDAFAAGDPEALSADGGNTYVILSLEPYEETAKTVQPIHPRKPKPMQEKLQDGPSKGGFGRKGPHGLVNKREPVRITIEQIHDIQTADGEPIEKGAVIVTDREINLLSDLFIQRELNGKEYNLFIPTVLDPEKTYPLILFIGDQSISGKEARITLEQGNGALCWVRPEFQKKHPCFVLAPAHYDEEPITNDLYEFTDQLFVIKNMCDTVIREYPIDTARVFTTGQSMGCMTSYELMHRYPGFFAAALCVSGHWTREKIADLARRGQNIWTILSELDGGGYPCITEVKTILDKEQTDYGWYEWNAEESFEKLGSLVKEAAAENHAFRVSIYTGESALHKGKYDEAPSGHPAGWYITYRIPEICEWLISQHRP